MKEYGRERYNTTLFNLALLHITPLDNITSFQMEQVTISLITYIGMPIFMD
jgi:hypothetical protein